MKAVANKTDTTPSKILVYDRIQLRAQYVQELGLFIFPEFDDARLGNAECSGLDACGNLSIGQRSGAVLVAGQGRQFKHGTCAVRQVDAFSPSMPGTLGRLIGWGA
ncbi:hypothetical protein G6F40_015538 [Rhizopus arrhizus]|nr:hypothetical protein G6F40_015538 [Rhizopus arrhizus]